jgi:hypothetical protein
MSIILSFGKWGGVYVSRGYSWRICLGWMAITFIPRDIDDVLDGVGYDLDTLAGDAMGYDVNRNREGE